MHGSSFASLNENGSVIIGVHLKAGVPRGATRDFKWRGWSNGAISQDPKESLDQKVTPKKSHADFVALKSSRKGLCYNTMKNIGNLTLVFVFSSYYLN